MLPISRKFTLISTGIFAAGAMAGAAAGWSAPHWFHGTRAMPAALQSSAAGNATSPIAAGAAPNYRAIVAENRAAVVGIEVTGDVKGGAGPPFRFGPFGYDPFGGGDNDPFFRFFRNIPGPSNRVPTRSLGSGFIVSPDGLVLTNTHVVHGAKEVMVTLSDHREFRAKVLGADQPSDVAVLKIDAHDLPTVHLGNSDRLQVGDYVLAIGEPFGLEETATAGIVSAKARSLPGDGYVPFIQTDAAVNPGNSGGPLFDASGAVVGINSQIYSNSGGYQGVSFAIPINLADQAEDQIVKTGKVEHGKLGVEVQTVDQSLAASFKLKAPGGALVSKVEPGSAAARAGLKSGDVILKYDGTAVTDAGALSMRVNTTAPGSDATLDVWRDGRPLTLTARIESATRTAGGNEQTPEPDNATLGLTLRPLTQDERDQAGVSGGLMVEDANGRGAEAGVQPGDVVLAVNGTPVKSVSQLRTLTEQHQRGVALLIARGDNRLYVPVQLG